MTGLRVGTFVFSQDYINQLQKLDTIRMVNLKERRIETMRMVSNFPIKIAGSAECQIIFHR